MPKSFGRTFLEATAVSAVLLFALLFAVGLAAGRLAAFEVVGLAALTGLGCGALTGLGYAVATSLARASRQEREAVLPCDFETACAHCRASFDLFPNHRLLDGGPGVFEAVVNNNPLAAGLPARATPQRWGWVERVKLTVLPPAGPQTTVRIETHADLNRALQVAVGRGRHTADILRENRETRCSKRD